MYAAILSEHRVSFEEAKDKIIEMGFKVVGRDLEQMEAVPRNVVLWMLFGFTGLYPSMPVRGFVKVASIEHRLGKSYVKAYNTPWYMKIYYKLLFGAMFWAALFKKQER